MVDGWCLIAHCLHPQADRLLQQAAAKLRELLKQAAAQVEVPYFMGSFEVRGVEAAPGHLYRSDLGCVLVCPDGELYEYTCSFEPGGSGERAEALRRLDLPPQDYLPYAYHALQTLARLAGKP